MIGHSSLSARPSPRAQDPPDALRSVYGDRWDLYGRARCVASRRVPLPGPQYERPGCYNVLLADTWDDMGRLLAVQDTVRGPLPEP